MVPPVSAPSGLSANASKAPQIGLARGGRPDDQFVDNLFTTQVYLPEYPPHRWMEPEGRLYGLFDEHPQPVAARDVQQLVAQHRVLCVDRQVEQASREQHDRTSDAEGDRLRDPSCHRNSAEGAVARFKRSTSAPSEVGALCSRRYRSLSRPTASQAPRTIAPRTGNSGTNRADSEDPVTVSAVIPRATAKCFTSMRPRPTASRRWCRDSRSCLSRLPAATATVGLRRAAGKKNAP